ncbi:oxidoreductase [Zhongshania borealis]|uniref:Oxidoreductase n=1 Tax=Zhongshania borealis TaxID=889488 RepID=A0ABP7WTS7_9GAMM
MIKLGVIGCGFSANTFHIPLIAASDSLTLSAISSSRRGSVATQYPGVAIYDTAQDLIEQSGVELAIITAPNEAHYSLAKQCLDRGIHVVLEKPMVTKRWQAEALLTLANERSLLLSVYHNRRWDGDFLTLKKLLGNDSLGEVRVFESHFDRFRPAVRQRWREQPGPGSGVWFDLGSHLVDQAITLFGLPTAVTARCLPLREGSETTDYFHVLLHYDNLECILHASAFAAAPSHRFRLEGTTGSYVKFGLDPQEEQLKSGMTPKELAYGVEHKADFGRVYSEFASELVETEIGCYQKYYEEIAAAIRLGGQNPVNPADAVNVIHILELAEESSRSGKTLWLNAPGI